MKNRPAYSIDSVDNALHLATILLLEGPMRVADAADRLGVARSTAHRLLAMLVYRDFAEQDGNRRYAAGPVLRRTAAVEPVAELRSLALPHLQTLSARVDETVNLMVVVADHVRFLASIQGSQVLRVGDREGRMLPAHLASGGRAVLAERPEAEVAALYDGPDWDDVDVEALLRHLRKVRRQGFAVNDQDTESGLTAIGRAVHGGHADAPAAVSIAMPTVRYRRLRLAEWSQYLAIAVERIEQDLRAATWHAAQESGPRQRTSGTDPA